MFENNVITEIKLLHPSRCSYLAEIIAKKGNDKFSWYFTQAWTELENYNREQTLFCASVNTLLFQHNCAFKIFNIIK